MFWFIIYLGCFSKGVDIFSCCIINKIKQHSRTLFKTNTILKQWSPQNQACRKYSCSNQRYIPQHTCVNLHTYKRRLAPPRKSTARKINSSTLFSAALSLPSLDIAQLLPLDKITRHSYRAKNKAPSGQNSD